MSAVDGAVRTFAHFFDQDEVPPSLLIARRVAAWLISGVGIGWCFIANAASFVAVLVALTMLDPS